MTNYEYTEKPKENKKNYPMKHKSFPNINSTVPKFPSLEI